MKLATLRHSEKYGRDLIVVTAPRTKANRGLLFNVEEARKLRDDLDALLEGGRS